MCVPVCMHQYSSLYRSKWKIDQAPKVMYLFSIHTLPVNVEDNIGMNQVCPLGLSIEQYLDILNDKIRKINNSQPNYFHGVKKWGWRNWVLENLIRNVQNGSKKVCLVLFSSQSEFGIKTRTTVASVGGECI